MQCHTQSGDLQYLQCRSHACKDYNLFMLIALADGTALIKSYHRVLCIIGVMSSCKSVCSELVGRGLLVHMEHLERFCGNPLTQVQYYYYGCDWLGLYS